MNERTEHHNFIAPPKIQQYSTQLATALALASALLSLGTTGPIRADTLTVCPTGCDSPSIQGAISMANENDEILIATTLPHTELDIVVFTSVTIKGLPGQATTVQAAAVPGGFPGRVFTVLEGTKLVLRDLWVRNGGGSSQGGIILNQGELELFNTVLSDGEANRGGILYNEGTTLCVDSYLQNGTAYDDGGGIYNRVAGVFEGSFCAITHNTSQPSTSDDALGGNIFSTGLLDLADSRVTNGLATAGAPAGGRGGGIYSYGDVVLERVFISNNRAENSYGGAGGLHIAGGTATLQQVDFESNTGTLGGAIYMSGTALTASDVELSNNEAVFSGGGIYINRGTVRLTRATIRNNTVNGNGGGIASGSSTAPDLANTTISGNTATHNGGGIYLWKESKIEISSSTIVDNTADSDGSSNGIGGGIYMKPGCINTICAPSAAHLRNTILANNQDSGPSSTDDCLGTIRSWGYNIVEVAGNTTFSQCVVDNDLTGVLLNTDPGLLTLADNGGPMIGSSGPLTHALSSSSPARDAGDPGGCVDFDTNPLNYDQRNAPRLLTCDIGAVEYGSEPPPLDVPLFSDGFESGNLAAWS